MLKLVQIQARLDIKGGQASIKQMSPQEAKEAALAQELIALHQTAIGLTRAELEAKIEKYSGARLDYREIDGLSKVISDSFATFQPNKLPFVLAEPAPPLSQETETEAEDKESETELSPLSRWRLATWEAVADPAIYPFANTQLLAQVMEERLEQGVKLNRRNPVAASTLNLQGDWLVSASKRAVLLQKAAETNGFSWDSDYILPNKPEQLLFSDLPNRHRLIALSEDLTVENLLNRYNIELLRGALYLAPQVKITVRDKYKDLFKYIKFFGLMHTITPLLDNQQRIIGYQIILEGASSPFLARTDRRYGIRFAQFLPALLLCEAEWQLEAQLVLADGQKAMYRLGAQPHLKTHFKGSGEFDSQLEESLAAQFERRFKQTTRKPTDEAAEIASKKKKAKKADPRRGWSIKREDRLISVYDTVMIPDFSFENVDGRRAMLEVVGFWEKSYLERKIAKLNKAGRTDLIVLVSERTRCGRTHFKSTAPNGELPYQLIFFKGKPQITPILEALERCAIIEQA